jgi:hypothetical protein
VGGRPQKTIARCNGEHPAGSTMAGWASIEGSWNARRRVRARKGAAARRKHAKPRAVGGVVMSGYGTEERCKPSRSMSHVQG